jgi:putative transposase
MSIEKAMQLIKGNFSFRARAELGLKCEIWQRGFSDVRVNDDGSFRAHQRYIHNNPVKAGLAASPEEFPYSSLHLRRLKLQGLNSKSEEVPFGTTGVVP